MDTHKEVNKLLTGFVLGELSREDQQQVGRHLAECSLCAEESRRLGAVLNCAEQMAKQTVNEAACESAREALLGAVNGQTIKTTAGSVKDPVSIWRTIMNTKITKLATAAVIIIGVFLGFNFLNSSTGVAWAEVVEYVQQVKTLRFHMIGEITGQPGMPEGSPSIKIEAVGYESSEYGSRVETWADGKLMVQMYMNPAEMVAISVIPESKRFSRITFTPEKYEEMQQQQKDPREFIKLFLSEDHTELGTKVIDGVKVKGIRAEGPRVGGGMFENAVGELWVDAESELPVLMEIDAAMGNGMQIHMVMDEFAWECEFEEGFFEPVIPDDYTLLVEIQAPDVNEDSLVEGLRFFAEKSKGEYPSSLLQMPLMRESTKLMKAEMGKGKDFAPDSVEFAEMQEGRINNMMKMLMPSHFYTQMVREGKEVEYHGDTVTADMPDEVLMRWKVSGGQWRVVYGDLRIETVSKEKLAELESNLLSK